MNKFDENFQGTASIPFKSVIVIIIVIAIGNALGNFLYDLIKSIF